MFDDIQTSVKAALYERIGNPLLSAFMISWLLWNYKFLLVLFSGMEYWEKLSHIEDLYPSFLIGIKSNIFLYPSISALIYFFVFPWFNLFATTYTEFLRKRLREEKLRYESEMPLSADQARKLRAMFLDLQKKNDQDIEIMQKEIDKYRGLLSPKAFEFSSYNDEYDGYHSSNFLELDQEEKKMIRIVWSGTTPVTFKYCQNMYGRSHESAEKVFMLVN